MKPVLLLLIFMWSSCSDGPQTTGEKNAAGVPTEDSGHTRLSPLPAPDTATGLIDPAPADTNKLKKQQ